MASTELRTPVALFIYRRPEKTALVLEAIANARPRVLYVVADGPRSEMEEAKCRKARALVENLSWPCEVRTNFSDDNLGCGRRMATGIDWVFSQEEEAILLEDDCLPAQSFFPFCEQLLERYRDDERVVHIGGDNFQNGSRATDFSYYFSKYTHIWGWASWRRAWEHFDYGMKGWPTYKNSGQLRKICPDLLEKRYWEKRFDAAYCGESNNWDTQWLFACWRRHSIAIVPSFNLVSNIGFGADATHTIGDHSSATRPTGDIWRISHPTSREIDIEADRYTFDQHYGGHWIRQHGSLRARGRRFISKLRLALASLLSWD